MRAHRRFLLSLALLSIELFATGTGFGQQVEQSAVPPSQQAGTSIDAPGAAPSLRTRGWRYTVRPSDTLEVIFSLTPEFNQTVTVQPDGYITLRGVGDLSVTGQTLPQLVEAVRHAYASVLRDPAIVVNPVNFEKPFFVVGGQVGAPGKFDWRGEVTLTQAIALAGGFTTSAKHSQVLLFRRVSSQWAEAKIIDVKKMFKNRDLHEDPILEPGDMLFVPKNAISKIRPYMPIPSLGMNMTTF